MTYWETNYRERDTEEVGVNRVWESKNI